MLQALFAKHPERQVDKPPAKDVTIGKCENQDGFIGQYTQWLQYFPDSTALGNRKNHT